MSDSYSGLHEVIDCWTDLADKTARRARSALRNAEEGSYDARDLARDVVGFYDDTAHLGRMIDYWGEVAGKTTKRARQAIRAAEHGKYGAEKVARDVVGFYGDIIPLTKIVEYWAEVASKTTFRARGALESAQRGDLSVEKVVRGVFGLSDDVVSAAVSLCNSLCPRVETKPVGLPASGVPTIPVNAPYGQDSATGKGPLGLTPGTVLTWDDLKHVGLPAAIPVSKANVSASVAASGDVDVVIKALDGVVVAGSVYRGFVRDAGTPIAEIVLSVGS